MSFTFTKAFASQEKHEVVYVFARPYWLVFLPAVIFFSFLFIAAFTVQYLLWSGIMNVGSATTNNVVVLSIGVFELVALNVFLVSLLDFWYDILIVTDRRLVTIDQEQLFYRKVAELNLVDVEDVSSEETGFLRTLLSYGNVTIQTAGTKDMFIIQNLRHAPEIAAIIASLADQAKAGVNDNKRIPACEVIAVINNALIKNPEDLIKAGIMQRTDPRSKHTFDED